MIAPGQLRIEGLEETHDRKGFTCGEPALDLYLDRYAGQDMRRRLARVLVAVNVEHPESILGYYSLSAANVAASELPSDLMRRLPVYPVPAALVGRLAVACAQQNKGLGSVLVEDAIQRVQSISHQVAFRLLIVDAKNEKAATFYERLGFRPLHSDRKRLFYPFPESSRI